MKEFKLFSIILLLTITYPNGSEGVFWPFSLIFGKSSDESSTTYQQQIQGPLSEIIVRPYTIGNGIDSTDLIPSSSSSLTSSSSSVNSGVTLQSNLLGSDVLSLKATQQQIPSSNYGYVNVDGQAGAYNSVNNVNYQSEASYQSSQLPQSTNEQVIPAEQSSFSAVSNEQSTVPITSYLFNPANLFDSKRLSSVAKFKKQQQQQQPGLTTTYSTKYLTVPNLDQNQYFIIQKPVQSSAASLTASTSSVAQTPTVSNVVEHTQYNANNQLQDTSTVSVQSSSSSSQQQQQQQQLLSSNQPQKISSNDWIYVSPVNKLNSQQQPVILEAYYQDSSVQHPQTLTTGQIGSIKGTVGKSGKHRITTSSYNNLNGGSSSSFKIPFLSWLPVSPNQIHLPLQWFKTKSQQYQHSGESIEETEKPLNYYGTTTTNVITQQQQQQQKPVYVYAQPSSVPSTSSASVVPGYITTQYVNTVPVKPSSSAASTQIQIQNSNQQLPVNNNAAVWSSSASSSSSEPVSSNTRLLSGTFSLPQQTGALQFWIDTERQQTPTTNRVLFPAKPVTLATNYQYVGQEYQPIRNVQLPPLPPSQASPVSQVESNQDLGGWDSMQMAEIVKAPQVPTSTQTSTLQQLDNSADDSNMIETMMPSASSADHSIVMNETMINQQQQPSSRIDTASYGNNQQQQQQQASHRVVYQQQQQQQQQQQSNSTTTTNARSLFSNPQFQSIYQMIQQSQQQKDNNNNNNQ